MRRNPHKRFRQTVSGGIRPVLVWFGALASSDTSRDHTMYNPVDSREQRVAHQLTFASLEKFQVQRH